MDQSFTRRDFLIKTPVVGSALYEAVTQAAAASVPASSSPAASSTKLEVEELTGNDAFAEFPSAASDGEGNAWAIWLERLGDDKERLIARKYQNAWLPQFDLTAEEAGYESPRIACAQSGQPMAAWIKVKKGEWLLESAASENDRFQSPVQVDTGGYRPSNPTLIAGAPGEFFIAWEGYKDGQFSTHLAHYLRGQWSKPVAITNGEANSYSPALGISRRTGSVWIAYSAITKDRELAIYLVNYDPAKSQLGAAQEVARGGYLKRRPNFNTYPAVHVDLQDRVWIAYEYDSNRSLRSYSMRPMGGVAGNHWGLREVRVLCLKDGKILQVVPNNAIHSGDRVLTEGNDHYPTFFEDAQSQLWLISRESTPKRRAWTVRASRLEEGKGWSKPVDLLGNLRKGRLSRPAIAIKDNNSLWLVWQADNVLGGTYDEGDPTGKQRLEWGKEEDNSPGKALNMVQNYDTVTVRSRIFTLPVLSPADADMAPSTLEPASAPELGSVFPPAPYWQPRPRIERRKVTVNGKDYTLLYGNLHEHSLISRCWDGGDDGTPDDDYRYGLDIEGYDFAALTDHCYDLYTAKWHEIRRAAEFYNDPPHFVALPAYEYTKTKWRDGIIPGNGHKNVIFAHAEDAARFVTASGNVCGAFQTDSDSPGKLWGLLRARGIKDVVTIPHHSADAVNTTSWDSHDPEYQTLVEIFQCRQSQEYEGCPRQAPFTTMYNQSYVQDALRKGYRMGFLASGDHQNMGEGLAAVLVEEVSRMGILEAMKARRCYGTTGDKIFLDFRVDGHFMGQEFSSHASSSNIEAVIDGTDELSSVVIFCNGEIIMEQSGHDLAGKKSLRVQYTHAAKGTRYYYVRAVQKNDAIAWSSPVWVDV